MASPWTPEPLRLLLFDIDGTLTRGGPARAAFALALERTFGTAGPVAGHDFSGKTDPQSARQLLTAAGLASRVIEAGLPGFQERYLSELEARIGAEPVTALPGVRSLIEALALREDVFLGLVTGNVEGGARLKLESVGLWDHFPVGGFGSDSAVRNELPTFALRRATAHWGRTFRGEDAVVIGDTPRDVACGKAVRASTVGVTTGRFPAAALNEAGADMVLPGLGDIAVALDAIVEAPRGRGAPLGSERGRRPPFAARPQFSFLDPGPWPFHLARVDPGSSFQGPVQSALGPNETRSRVRCGAHEARKRSVRA